MPHKLSRMKRKGFFLMPRGGGDDGGRNSSRFFPSMNGGEKKVGHDVNNERKKKSLRETEVCVCSCVGEEVDPLLPRLIKIPLPPPTEMISNSSHARNRFPHRKIQSDKLLSGWEK